MEFIKIAACLQRPAAFPAVLATLVSVQGSSYRRQGARMVFTADGQRVGSISGGCLESDLSARAEALLRNASETELITYDTTSENDLLWGVGTGCHGVVQVLLEHVRATPSWAAEIATLPAHRRPLMVACAWSAAAGRPRGTWLSDPPAAARPGILTTPLLPPWRLVIFGAGDDAQPVVTLAHTLGWQTLVCDERPGLISADRFPEADEIKCLSSATAAAAITWDDRTLAVVMTHHYRFDLPLLRTLLPLNLTFLGLLGPRERGARLLQDAGFDPASVRDQQAWHSPVGLDLGGDGPAAVALSIVAEIQAHLHRRDARSLRDRLLPIHAD